MRKMVLHALNFKNHPAAKSILLKVHKSRQALRFIFGHLEC